MHSYSLYSPRYALKSVKYFLQSVDFNSEGYDGPALSALYFRSRTGENETVLGDAERVRTDAIPFDDGGVYKQVLVTPVDSRGCTAAGRRLVIFACEMVYLRGRRRVIARSHCELATASRRAIPGRWTSAAVFHNRETSLTSLLHYEKGDSINIVKNTEPTPVRYVTDQTERYVGGRRPTIVIHVQSRPQHTCCYA